MVLHINFIVTLMVIETKVVLSSSHSSRFLIRILPKIINRRKVKYFCLFKACENVFEKFDTLCWSKRKFYFLLLNVSSFRFLLFLSSWRKSLRNCGFSMWRFLNLSSRVWFILSILQRWKVELRNSFSFWSWNLRARYFPWSELSMVFRNLRSLFILSLDRLFSLRIKNTLESLLKLLFWMFWSLLNLRSFFTLNYVRPFNSRLTEFLLSEHKFLSINFLSWV